MTFEGFFANEYVRIFLGGVANWAGNAAGPILMAAFALLWAQANNLRKNAELSRDQSQKEKLNPADSHQLTGETLIRFHLKLVDNFTNSSLPELKRSSKLSKLTTEFSRLESTVTNAAVSEYLSAVRQFLESCWDAKNKKQALWALLERVRQLVNPAAEALSYKPSEFERERLARPLLTRSMFWLLGVRRNAEVSAI